VKLDEQLTARLLKGVSVGAEVSTECRRETLCMIETLAVCYADEIAPTNTLTITVLLTHALELMLALRESAGNRAGLANASSATVGMAAAVGMSGVSAQEVPTTPGSGADTHTDRTAREVASDALRFLERNGSASFERLVDLFKEAKDGGAMTTDASLGTNRRESFDKNSPPKAMRQKQSSRKSLERIGLTGQEAWHESLFDERFFESFALAFTGTDEVAFSLRLLTDWLIAASRPLLGDKLHRRSTDAGKGGTTTDVPYFSPTRGARVSERSARSRAEARHSRRVVVSLLRLLSACLRQYAPTECHPDQFSALAPIVVAHFTHFTQHFAHQKLEAQEDVARTAERLLSEMVSRAPRGTPPSIFSLLASSARASTQAVEPTAGSKHMIGSSASSPIAWDMSLVPPSEVSELSRSLHECADRLQACVFEVDCTAESVACWPPDLPKASIAELPNTEQQEGRTGRASSTSSAAALATDPPAIPAVSSLSQGSLGGKTPHRRPSAGNGVNASKSGESTSGESLLMNAAAGGGRTDLENVTRRSMPAIASSDDQHMRVPSPPPPPPPHSPPPDGSSSLLPSAEEDEDLQPDEDDTALPPRPIGPVADSQGSWISTIGPLARLSQFDDADEYGPIDGDEEDEELMVGLDDDDDDDDEGDFDDGIDGEGQPAVRN